MGLVYDQSIIQDRNSIEREGDINININLDSIEKYYVNVCIEEFDKNDKEIPKINFTMNKYDVINLKKFLESLIPLMEEEE